MAVTEAARAEASHHHPAIGSERGNATETATMTEIVNATSEIVTSAGASTLLQDRPTEEEEELAEAMVVVEGRLGIMVAGSMAATVDQQDQMDREA